MSLLIQNYKAYTGHNASVYALCLDEVRGILYSGDGDGNIVAWQIENAEGVLVAKMPYSVFSLAICSEKNLLIAGNNAGGIAFIDLVDKKIIKHVAHHDKGTFGILVLEKNIYTIGGDGICSLWNLETLKAEVSVQLSSKNLRQISWSTTLQKIIIASSDGNIYFLSKNLEQVNYLKNIHDKGIFTAQISTDAKYILSGGRDAQLRYQLVPDFKNVSEGLIAQPNFTTDLPAHNYTINAVLQNLKSPNLWISASRDRNIKIWKILPEASEKIKLSRVLTGIRDGGHVRSVNILIASENSKQTYFDFFSAGDDKKIIRWRMNILASE